MKNVIVIMFILLSIVMGLTGCSTDADMASHNLSKAAEMFEINRRVVFYNGITDAYILAIEGSASSRVCSIQHFFLRMS